MTPREKEILNVVTNCVRALTVDQVASSWWNANRWGHSRARAALERLAEGGWLKMQPALARPTNSLEHPLTTWRPGEVEPDFESLSAELRRRAHCAAVLTSIVFATDRSTALFGRGRLPTLKLTQLGHDLNVAEIFLVYRRRGLNRDRWIGEDHLPASWAPQQRPDGLIVRPDGSIERAIEYGGAYFPQRLAELHRAFSAESISLAYEIW